jgi:hypothetical protein
MRKSPIGARRRLRVLAEDQVVGSSESGEAFAVLRRAATSEAPSHE